MQAILKFAVPALAFFPFAAPWNGVVEAVGSVTCNKVILPHNTEYRKLCENTSPTFDLTWPCFSHLSSDLHEATIYPKTLKEKDTILYVKNGDLTGM